MEPWTTLTDFSDLLLRFPWGRLALFALAFYLILCIYAWCFADRILFPAPRGTTKEPVDGVFFISDSDGMKIACKSWVPDAPKGVTLLYSHGNAEDLSMIEENLLHWSEEGWEILAYDYPGYGSSEGKPSEEGCYRAIDAVYGHLIEQLGKSPESVVLWGRSLGTGPSCYLASREKVGGVILETPFMTAYRTVTETRVLPWDRFDNLERAPAILCRSLVLHGHQDEVVPFRHGKRVFQALSQPKRLVEFEDGSHNDLPEKGGERYRYEINEFLKEVLGD